MANVGAILHWQRLLHFEIQSPHQYIKLPAASSQPDSIMLKTQIPSLCITKGTSQFTLSKEQKAFNTLIKKIEAKRSILVAWQEIMPRYQQKYISELLPLINITQSMNAEIVYCLDLASDKKGLTKSERSKIAAVITELTEALLAERGPDEGLKNLYNKYSGSDFDADEAAVANSIKSMLELMMGIDLGDDLDISSPEDLMKRAQAQMQEQQSKNDATRQAQEKRQSTRKKIANQLAKEKQQKAEEQEVSQSLREVYRTLVSVLHPDRESDPLERDRKTVLMQRVNDAHDKKNLLMLLELQLELEHIDQNAINNISESRLKHFLKILKEQLAELEDEILYTENMFKTQFGIHPFVRLLPNTLMRNLDREIVEIEHNIRDQGNYLQAFEDIKSLKAWLKSLGECGQLTQWPDV